MLTRVERALARRRLERGDADMDALPDPNPPQSTETLPQIRHIVVLMMENHSYDNYLGLLDGRGDGYPTDANGDPTPTNPRLDGSSVGLSHFPGTTQDPDSPTQSWNASHLQSAGGTNDGFVQSVQLTEPTADPVAPMGYWTPADLPFYAGLASAFPLADRWFCSCLGPTFPNRRFLIAGTAHGLIDDDPFSLFDYPESGTLFDLLDAHGISWVNYHHVSTAKILLKRLLGAMGLKAARRVGRVGVAASPSLAEAMQGNLQFTADLFPAGVLRCLNHLRPIGRFFEDAARGTLPAVSIVDPDFQNGSEENPQDIRIGERFAATVVNAVMAGKGWPSTLLVWLYDEHGGYFDHVPPPLAVAPDSVTAHSLLDSTGLVRWLLKRSGRWQDLERADSGPRTYEQYGFRVPAVIVSPYARPNFVTSQNYDHTSILKLIERKWNLPPLTKRDASAVDPLEALDLENEPAFLTPPVLPAPAMGDGT